MEQACPSAGMLGAASSDDDGVVSHVVGTDESGWYEQSPYTAIGAAPRTNPWAAVRVNPTNANSFIEVTWEQTGQRHTFTAAEHDAVAPFDRKVSSQVIQGAYDG